MAQKIDQDVGRFKQIVRGRIKKELRKFISTGELIGKKGKDLVSIPIPRIDIPHFIYGDKDQGGLGQGEGGEGGEVRPGDGSAQAGNAPGEHLLEVDVTFEELAALLGEELELPRIRPKGTKDLDSKSIKYTGMSTAGPESLRHFKRTYRKALKRQVMSGTYDPKRPLIVPVREDRVYRTWRKVETPKSRALIVYMMDVSGCHTAGHFVEMGDGSYKDVSDVVAGDEVACVDVLQRRKTRSKVTETFRYKVKRTIRICTEDHISLAVTPNHRYFVYDEKADRIIEKEACEIEAGDLLILVNQFGRGAWLPGNALGRAEAFLFGVILGDGHVSERIDEADSGRNNRFVMITDENLARLSYYADSAHTAFGIKGLIREKGGRNRLYLNSVDLVERIAREMPSLCEKSRNRYVEPLIFKQPPEIRAEFLKGLFDAEGTIASHAVEMLSSSLNLVKHVKLLLSYWGIRARICEYLQPEREISGNKVKEGIFYRLIINSKDAIIFADNIGFSCREKTKKLNALCQRQEDGTDAMRSRYIPAADLKDTFGDIPSIEKIKSRLYEVERNAYSRANIERMRQFAGSDRQNEVIEKTIKEAFLACRVKSVEESDCDAEVYDFTVDRFNNYIVDGVLSHNSMGDEQKEIVRLECFWIDTWIRSQYEGVDVRYIIHDAVAREVDRHTFFHTRESGGTIISSAYKLFLKILEEKYNVDEWNIYPFHFSDGDNWSGNDTEECMNLLDKRILPIANMFCYGQVESEYGSGQFLKDLDGRFKDSELVVTSKIPNRDAIVDSIKTFLGKGK
jgi:uncharacterized sporulation protein YeaH/YhbH (DUF444 family)